MKLSPIHFSTIIGLMLLSTTGCAQIFPTQAPTDFPDAAYTQAAVTVIAALTQNAPPTLPATSTPEPTQTQVVTETPLPTNTPLPTATTLPSPTPTSPATPTLDAASLLYFEDFSGDSGWVEQSEEGWSMGQVDSGYSIHVKISHAPIWSIRNQEFSDVRLEVDAARVEGPLDGYYGLVCRHIDGDNYYTLVISSDGFFGIALREDGEKLRFLVEGKDEAGIILSGTASNHLRADCVGSTLSLYANGQKLVEVQDSSLESGDTGLLVGTLKDPGLRVLFSNYAIYNPAGL